jgi:hypothetical protein
LTKLLLLMGGCKCSGLFVIDRDCHAGFECTITVVHFGAFQQGGMNSGWNRSAALSTTEVLGFMITTGGDGGLLRHRKDRATDD